MISTSAMAVAVEVDEPQVGVAQVAVQARSEGAERLPAFGLVVLVEAGRRAVQDDQVGLAVTGEVHELAPRRSGQDWV